MSSRSARGSPPLRLLAEAGLLAVVGAAVLLDSRGYPPSLAEGAPGPGLLPSAARGAPHRLRGLARDPCLARRGG